MTCDFCGAMNAKKTKIEAPTRAGYQNVNLCPKCIISAYEREEAEASRREGLRAAMCGEVHSPKPGFERPNYTLH